MRIELEWHLVELRARSSRLRALLTVRRNSPVVTADGKLLLKFYELSEKQLLARIELYNIESRVGEMRSMIAKGLSSVPNPSFRTRLLALSNPAERREKLLTMINHLRSRKAELRKQISRRERREFPEWQALFADIEQRSPELLQFRRPVRRTAARITAQEQPSASGQHARRKITKRQFAMEAIAEIWRAHPDAPYKDIARLATELKVPVPWPGFCDWPSAMAGNESACKTLLGNARAIGKTRPHDA